MQPPVNISVRDMASSLKRLSLLDRVAHVRLAAVERDQHDDDGPEGRLDERFVEVLADEDRPDLDQHDRADHSPHVGAAAPHERGAADDHRGDGLEQVGLPDVAVG